MVDDEVKVGSEVIASDECAEQDCNSMSMSNGEIEEHKKVGSNPSVEACGKRKGLKCEGSPTPRKRSELGKKNVDEECKDSGIKKSPVQKKKTRVVSSERGGNEFNLRKVKSDSGKARKSCELRKMKSEPTKNLQDGNFKNSLQLVKAESLTPAVDEHVKRSDDDDEECKDLKGNEEDRIQSITNKNVESSIDEKPKKVVIKEKKLHRSAPNNHIPAANHPKRVSDGGPSKIQSLADLIMWKDVPRSTFVFGIGSFAIISSSYTNDLNISLISLLSYLGLVYLAFSFIFRSIISRGNMDMDNIKQEYVVGEEEAVWLVKLFLPYVNEFLVKLRGLFSGDPPTTMKLAVLLFVSARCGGSITIWKMTKLGFFGVFIVPKLCSSYSSHLAAYGSFWIRRFGDAWESCSHKRAVGFGILTLVWNQCSVVGRIWGLFILFVAFKHYHHHTYRYEAQPKVHYNK